MRTGHRVGPAGLTPVLVEFLGLPASGKSTTLKAATARMEADGLKTYKLQALDGLDSTQPAFTRRVAGTRALYRYEEFRAQYPDCAQMIDTFGAQQTLHKTLLTSVCARYRTHAANPVQDRIFVADEGLVHRAVHMIHSHDTDPEPMVRRFCEAIPLPDVIVVMDVSAATCHQRALERIAARKNLDATSARVRRRVRNAHGDAAGFANRAALIQTALDTLAARDVTITRIPEDASPDAAAALAIAAMQHAPRTLKIA